MRLAGDLETKPMVNSTANSENRVRILVVDDEGIIRTDVAEGLREAGYLVSTASSGADAIRLADQDRPDLALLDVNMKHMSGLEVAKRLRDHTEVGFMFLSACRDEETVNQAAEYGTLGYIVKPFDIRQILPQIRVALARAEEIRILRKESKNLVDAIERGREINRAMGVLMERHRLDRDQAFAQLRDEARRRRQKLSLFAKELLRATELLNFPLAEAGNGKGAEPKP